MAEQENDYGTQADVDADDLASTDALQDLQATIKALADAVDAEREQLQLTQSSVTSTTHSPSPDAVEYGDEIDVAQVAADMTSAAPAASGTAGAEPSLDELLAALNIKTTAVAAEDGGEMPAQVPQIEDLWQQLGVSWPVIEGNPQIVARIEELWGRLKDAHLDGRITGNYSLDSLLATLPSADDNDGAGTVPRRSETTSSEVAEIVRRILAGESSVQVAQSFGGDTADTPAPASDQVDETLQSLFLSVDTPAAAAPPAAVSEAPAFKPQHTGRKTFGRGAIRISDDEKQLLDRIMGGDTAPPDAGGSKIDITGEKITTTAVDREDESTLSLDERLQRLLREAGIDTPPAFAATVGDDPSVGNAARSPSAPAIPAPKVGTSSTGKPARRVSRPPTAAAKQLAPASPATTVSSTNKVGDASTDSGSLLPLSLVATLLIAAAVLWYALSPSRTETTVAAKESAPVSRTARASATGRLTHVTPAEHVKELTRELELGNAAGGKSGLEERKAPVESAAATPPPAAAGIAPASATPASVSSPPPLAQQPASAGGSTLLAGSSDVRRDNVIESLNSTSERLQTLVDGSLDRLRSSTQSSLQELSQRVGRLEDAISRLQLAIDSLLHRSETADSVQHQRFQEIGSRLEALETAQQKAYQANIQRDNEGVTIVLTEPLVAGAAGTAGATLQEFVHIVVKGDTLWDIAAKYINNPFRYPELARLSKIKNPDLIYPGDRVRIIRRYGGSVPAR